MLLRGSVLGFYAQVTDVIPPFSYTTPLERIYAPTFLETVHSHPSAVTVQMSCLRDVVFLLIGEMIT